MITDLTPLQVETLLGRQLIGRIGCMAEGRIYVVPVSYAYHDNSVYVHTYEGLKITAMRKAPAVCFETDDYTDMANWQSVIAWGRFEELLEPEQKEAATRYLLQRKLPVPSSSTTHLGKNWPFYDNTTDKIDGVFFRIVLDEKTGRTEHSKNVVRFE